MHEQSYSESESKMEACLFRTGESIPTKNLNIFENFESITPCENFQNLCASMPSLSSLAPESPIEGQLLEEIITLMIEKQQFRTFADVIPYQWWSLLNQGLMDGVIKQFLDNHYLNRSALFCVLPDCRSITNSHWSLGIILLNSRRIILFDSIHDDVAESQTEQFRLMWFYVQLIVMVAQLENAKDIDDFLKPETWSFVWASDVPKQTNGYDCGLHVVLSAYSILSRKSYVTLNNSEFGRLWIFQNLVRCCSYLLNDKNIKSTRCNRIKSNGIISNMSKVWNNRENIYLNITRQPMHDILPLLASKDWQIDCGYLYCAKGQNHCKAVANMNQIFCCKCRRWYHESCIEKTFPPNTIYLICC